MFPSLIMDNLESEPLEKNDEEKPLVPQLPEVPLPREGDDIWQKRIVELVELGVSANGAIQIAGIEDEEKLLREKKGKEKERE